MPNKTPLVFGNNSNPVVVNYGAPSVKSATFFLASTAIVPAALKVAINKAIPAAEPTRTVTLTVAIDTAADTVGGIVITGKDDAGRTIVERFVPTAAGADATWANAEVYTTKQAFRQVDSVELTGYEVSGGAANDSYSVGFGDEIGLGVKLASVNDVFWCTVDDAVRAHKGEVVVSATDVNLNTIDLSAATFDGVKPVKVLLVPRA